MKTHRESDPSAPATAESSTRESGSGASDPLESLFDYLAPDRDQAGEKYEALRQVLLKFFDWRGALSSSDLADRTLDRVAQKIAEGEQIRNLNGYCHKVAQFIFLEWINREHDHKHEPIEGDQNLPAVRSFSDEGPSKEDRLECQKTCLHELPSDSLQFVQDYFSGEGRDRAHRREAIATRLEISRTALGNRVNRLLGKLRECERKCLKRKKLV